VPHDGRHVSCVSRLRLFASNARKTAKGTNVNLSKARLAVLGGVLAGVASGCAGLPTQISKVNAEVPKQATAIALKQGIASAQEKENQQQMLALLSSPEVKGMQAQVVAGFLDGTLDALGSDGRASRLASQLGPIAAGVARNAIDTTLEQPVGGSGDLGARMATALNEDLGPALQNVVRENVGQGAIAVLGDPEFSRAMGAVARSMGREAVLGANEAITEIQNREGAAQDTSTFGRVGTLAKKGAELAGTASIFLGVLVLALGVWAVKLVTQARRYRAESEQHAATAAALRDALRDPTGTPLSRNLAEEVASS